jgi:hypothetical protein
MSMTQSGEQRGRVASLIISFLIAWIAFADHRHPASFRKGRPTLMTAVN